MAYSSDFQTRAAELRTRESTAERAYETAATAAERARVEALELRETMTTQARAEAEQKRVELEAALSRDARAALACFADFADVTKQRAVAASIAGAWRDLNMRAMRELGSPLDWHHLLVAIAGAYDYAANAMHPEAASFPDSNNMSPAVAAAVHAMLNGELTPSIVKLLADAELAVARQVKAWGPRADRLAALEGAATVDGVNRALALADAAHDGAVQAANYEAALEGEREGYRGRMLADATEADRAGRTDEGARIRAQAEALYGAATERAPYVASTVEGAFTIPNDYPDDDDLVEDADDAEDAA